MSNNITQNTTNTNPVSTNGQKQLYITPPLIAEDELDKLKKAIFLFSCFRKVSGQSSKTLRPRLIILLALYLKYGVTPETKKKASEILGVDKSGINCMNLELRGEDYLLKDKYTTRINHLHDDLKVLQEYVASGGDNELCFLFTIKDE